mmetsp:Transcript_128101/g.292745  ORF Transcript_128101/g.292745 Transcript_128101/m.292745 type:complete len:696 (-) Transcript_128101:261-2348(-)
MPKSDDLTKDLLQEGLEKVPGGDIQDLLSTLAQAVGSDDLQPAPRCDPDGAAAASDFGAIKGNDVDGSDMPWLATREPTNQAELEQQQQQMQQQQQKPKREVCELHGKPVCSFKARERATHSQRKCECRAKNLATLQSHCHHDDCVTWWCKEKAKRREQANLYKTQKQQQKWGQQQPWQRRQDFSQQPQFNNQQHHRQQEYPEYPRAAAPYSAGSFPQPLQQHHQQQLQHHHQQQQHQQQQAQPQLVSGFEWAARQEQAKVKAPKPDVGATEWDDEPTSAPALGAPVASTTSLTPGDLMLIDPQNPAHLYRKDVQDKEHQFMQDARAVDEGLRQSAIRCDINFDEERRGIGKTPSSGEEVVRDAKAISAAGFERRSTLGHDWVAEVQRWSDHIATAMCNVAQPIAVGAENGQTWLQWQGAQFKSQALNKAREEYTKCVEIWKADAVLKLRRMDDSLQKVRTQAGGKHAQLLNGAVKRYLGAVTETCADFDNNMVYAASKCVLGVLDCCDLFLAKISPPPQPVGLLPLAHLPVTPPPGLGANSAPTNLRASANEYHPQAAGWTGGDFKPHSAIQVATAAAAWAPSSVVKPAAPAEDISPPDLDDGTWEGHPSGCFQRQVNGEAQYCVRDDAGKPFWVTLVEAGVDSMLQCEHGLKVCGFADRKQCKCLSEDLNRRQMFKWHCHNGLCLEKKQSAKS